MRSLTPFLVLSTLLCGGCAWLRSPEPATFLDQTPVFEVSPANGVWDGEYGKTRDPENCSFSFRLTRWPDGIEVEATVRDDRVVTDSCPVGAQTCPSWDDDSFACFFDTDNDHSPDVWSEKKIYGGAYALVANGAAQSDRSSCPNGFGTMWTGTVSDTRLGAAGHELCYRLRFSWAGLGYAKPPADTEDVSFGFNACVHDDDTGGRGDRALYWKGTHVLPYRDERHFETVVLKGRSDP